MQITSEKFNELFRQQMWGAKLFMLERGRAVIHQQYCNKLTMRGACSGDCKACGVHIGNALDWMHQQNTPKFAYGIFGKIMKTAFAKRVEEMTQRPAFKPETNTLGEPTERHGLDILLETFNG